MKNNKIGVWIDFRTANIIQFDKDESILHTIESAIEEYNIKGGARSKVPWGPMDKTSESKYLERRQQHEKAYYKKVANAVKDANELVIIGPGEAKTGFKKYLVSIKYPTKFSVSVADSMSQNQKIATVKELLSL